MVNAYLILDTKIKSACQYEEYKKLAKPIIESYGGTYLARGGELHTDQSDLWAPSRIVVIRFESMQKAKRFLTSDEYKPVKALRIKAAQSTTLLVEGL